MTRNTEEQESVGGAKVAIRNFFKHENAVLLIILIGLISGISAITHGLTTSRANMMNVLLQSATRGVAAIGEAFVILTAGIDVSVGGVGLMCSILGASLLTQDMGLNIAGSPMSMYLVVPIMLLVGTGWGTANGMAVSRIGMPSLIVTLAIWQIAEGVGFRISEGITVHKFPESFNFIGGGDIAGVPVPVVILIVCAIIAYFFLNHTTYGKSLYAVGGNPVTAWLSGIDTKKILFSAYVISGFMAGLAAVIMTSRVMSASMKTLVGLEIDTIAAVVIGGVSLTGGRGNILGVVIGVIIMGVIDNGMSAMVIEPALVGIVKGIIIFAAVAIDFLRRR